ASMRPNLAAAWAMDLHASSSETSPCASTASAPAARTAAAVASASVTLLAELMITTLAPPAAAPTPSAPPKPVEAAVTRTILPSKSRMGAPQAGCAGLPAGDRLFKCRLMSTDPKGLTQLGQASSIPASPEQAKLERVPNPHPGTLYLARFTAPE